MLVSHLPTCTGFTAAQQLKPPFVIACLAALRNNGGWLTKMYSSWLCICTLGFEAAVSRRHSQDRVCTTWPKMYTRGSLSRSRAGDCCGNLWITVKGWVFIQMRVCGWHTGSKGMRNQYV